MKGTDIVAIVSGIVVFIFLVAFLPNLHCSSLGGQRPGRRRTRSTYRYANSTLTPKHLLPISAQQAGDASDIRSAPDSSALTPDTYYYPTNSRSSIPKSLRQARESSDSPDANTRTFTRGRGRGKSVVLKPPPPAVTRGIDLGRPVEPSTLPPMYMDGSDG